jgi:DNA helicase IV
VATHPDLEAEQAHVDRAYAEVARLRREIARNLESVLDQGKGGTHQFREERDVIVRTGLARLEQLDIGEQPLCFGRIDRLEEDTVASYHIGRLGVSGEGLEPLVVDWRAPVAEPFYRATGRDPMGLVLRRHLAVEGRRVVALEDEWFAGPKDSLGAQQEKDGRGAESEDHLELGGPGALLAVLGSVRTGRMRDIVSTIQGEQDAIVRAPLNGVLVVQGGPGTGKTAVALHRAAYLLYTHRFPLERQGVLVIGPNPLFLRYIEHVLPSLGESGVTLSTIGGLVGGITPRAEERGDVAHLKGDPRMANVVARAVRTRQRALRSERIVPFGSAFLRFTPDDSAVVVSSARRRPGSHNSRRRFVEQMVIRRLADTYQKGIARQGFASAGASEDDEAEEEEAVFDLVDFGQQIRQTEEFRGIVDRIWPRLTAEELLHDLFGAPPLLRLAAKGVLSAAESHALFRPRSRDLLEIPWTPADIPLIDEARLLLGERRGRVVGGEADDGPRTYGHIVVDEAQDLSPMQLRMISRRSLSGSVTAVGDIGQATGAWAGETWEDITAHLPTARPPRMVELSVSYRTPAEVIEVAAKVLRVAAPDLRPPIPVRQEGVVPTFEAVPDPEALGAVVARVAARVAAEVAPGTAAVLVPNSLVGEIAWALDAAGVEAADPRQAGLGAPLSLLPVDLVNGLEFDAVVVVEPAGIVEEGNQGLRALYVALTRPTRRLAVVHHRDLPADLES